MATAEDCRVALALEGTTEAPHVDRTAVKVRRIYATLAGAVTVRDGPRNRPIRP
jgi:hypothetical protein